ncbi:MAG: MotA/TolQ/ExbB proton channel family protein [Gemmatimonadota bacterium]
MTRPPNPRPRPSVSKFAAALFVIGAIAPALAAAQTASGASSMNYSLIDLIKFGGLVGYVIIFMSVVAVALVFDEELVELREAIGSRAFDRIAARAGDENASFVCKVVAGGVKERARGYDAVVKAMEDTADEQTGYLLRKIEHLNIIANIAPMLGLLGTVIGMVNSFNQISVAVGGVDPRRLAGGIFQALMTTVMGLIVAIPSLYAFGIFRNRVDSIVADASAKAADLVEPLKNHTEGHP